MISRDGGWWVDEHGNKWDAEVYHSRELAERASRTLLRCDNCVDCEFCVDCSSCRKCVNCSKCIGCEGCSYCHVSNDLKACEFFCKVLKMIDLRDEMESWYDSGDIDGAMTEKYSELECEVRAFCESMLDKRKNGDTVSSVTKEE